MEEWLKRMPPPTRATDEATVVFMRSAFSGKAIAASVFDVTQSDTKFIGVVQNDTKVAYNVPAGDQYLWLSVKRQIS